MTKHSHLDEEIRALRPADNGWATSERGKTVMNLARNNNSLVSGSRPAGTSRLKWSPRTLVIGGLASLVAVGTAAAVITVAIPDDPAQAGCYSTLSGQADMTEAASGLVKELGPTEACRQTWQTIGQDVDTTNLVLCITPSGGRGVFPAAADMTPAQACGQIGQRPEVQSRTR